MAGLSIWGRLQFKVPLHILRSSFVTTPPHSTLVMWQLAALRPVGSMITPYVRGVFRGGWEGWSCGD